MHEEGMLRVLVNLQFVVSAAFCDKGVGHVESKECTPLNEISTTISYTNAILWKENERRLRIDTGLFICTDIIITSLLFNTPSHSPGGKDVSSKNNDETDKIHLVPQHGQILLVAWRLVAPVLDQHAQCPLSECRFSILLDEIQMWPVRSSAHLPSLCNNSIDPLVEVVIQQRQCYLRQRSDESRDKKECNTPCHSATGHTVPPQIHRAQAAVPRLVQSTKRCSGHLPS